MEKDNPREEEEKTFNNFIQSEEEEELNDEGNKFYKFEEGDKLLSVISEFNTGEIFFDDVKRKIFY